MIVAFFSIQMLFDVLFLGLKVHALGFGIVSSECWEKERETVEDVQYFFILGCILCKVIITFQHHRN